MVFELFEMYGNTNRKTKKKMSPLVSNYYENNNKNTYNCVKIRATNDCNTNKPMPPPINIYKFLLLYRWASFYDISDEHEGRDT